jgi:hypothetical protein
MQIGPPPDGYPGEWESETQDYRVVFWHQQAPPDGHTQEEMGYSELTYDVSGAEDVLEVVEWAETEAVREDSIYCIYAKLGPEVRDGGGLLQVAGVDPTRDPRFTGFRRRLPCVDTESPASPRAVES